MSSAETSTQVLRLDAPNGAYDILIGYGLLEEARLLDFLGERQGFALVYDENVLAHAQRFLRATEACSLFGVVESIVADERLKSLDSYTRLCHSLLDQRLERNMPVVAIGGGITGDMAGFLAATYQRGVPFVQCPTTLLAMVDASVGGKVAVNLGYAKNMIGAFYQPKMVLIDLSTLSTLPKRHIRSGLSECIKHGILADAELFDWTVQNIPHIEALVPEVVHQLVARNVALKAAIVSEDPQERGKRALLNLGHTFGHALESLDHDKRYMHGEAVSIGVIAASWLSVQRGMTSAEDLQAIESAYRAAGLPTQLELGLSPAELLDAMRKDKKVEHRTIRLVLPRGVGKAEVVDDVPQDLILAAWCYVSNSARLPA